MQQNSTKARSGIICIILAIILFIVGLSFTAKANEIYQSMYGWQYSSASGINALGNLFSGNIKDALSGARDAIAYGLGTSQAEADLYPMCRVVGIIGLISAAVTLVAGIVLVVKSRKSKPYPGGTATANQQNYQNNYYYQQNSQQQSACPYCRMQIPVAGSAFCPYCGARIR